MMNTGEIFSRLKGQHVLIIGDVMIDRYLKGQVSRISPEAPVPVVLHAGTENRLGGAANVALNIGALGGIPTLCSVCGVDEAGKQLIHDLLPGHGLSSEGLVLSDKRSTTIKTRILANNQQMLRIDQEMTDELSQEDADQLISRVAASLDRFPVRVIIFQDYNKGVLSKQVIQSVLSMAATRGIITAADPKKSNFYTYEGVDLFKPNFKEIRDAVPFPIDATGASLQKAAQFIQSKLNHRYTMITLSEQGLFLDSGHGGTVYPTTSRKVADVSGAGDTVISVAALALGAQMEWPLIATLCNIAGGQVCESPGVVSVDANRLRGELEGWLSAQGTAS